MLHGVLNYWFLLALAVGLLGVQSLLAKLYYNATDSPEKIRFPIGSKIIGGEEITPHIAALNSRNYVVGNIANVPISGIGSALVLLLGGLNTVVMYVLVILYVVIGAVSIVRKLGIIVNRLGIVHRAPYVIPLLLSCVLSVAYNVYLFLVMVWHFGLYS